ncbi:hypothetical protein Shyd_93740 [Streptomyces hydrogenans]|uniref:Secreted protein n=1 Tax=Streptomyces hydrogenans TaxID=1873719 RepID=A0ABQ3PSJ5_9ACTN|nr:hypothetical protein Shyd_93740 [Streptomyces hydrogenans]
MRPRRLAALGMASSGMATPRWEKGEGCLRGADAFSTHQVHEPAARVPADRQRISAEVVQQSCQPGGLFVLPTSDHLPTRKDELQKLQWC